MAQLKSGSTVGGNSILTTASSVGFPSGTVMVFHQASAPTGWTKSTSHNNKTLRVVSGSGGGSGGTHALTSPPSTSHTHTGPSHTHSTPSHSHSHTLSAGAHTLSTAQMPSHSHTLVYNSEYTGSVITFDNGPSRNHTTGWISRGSTDSTGGGGSHSHSLAGSITSGGSGTSGAGGTGATGSAGPTAFAPQYIDVIVCSKD
jgi:microcystin-dependent protein